ncbi:MAG: pyruvate dehydrogenase complex dihydrolipoamide acetyltransferase [Planctomycetota bacterium]
MPIEITMPRLSDTMEQGTVVKWNVKEGDSVSAGDVIADVETDKATMELQAFDDGTVAKIAAPEGEQVAVGTIIAVLAADGEDVAEAAASAGGAAAPAAKAAENTAPPSVPEPPAATATAAPPPAQANGSTNGTAATSRDREGAETNGTGGRVFASPLARKIAAERGIDLASITGTGPSGRIIRKDVESAQPAAAPVATAAPLATLPTTASPLEDKTVALNNVRGTIARRLVESKQTIPHYQVTVSARLDALAKLRSELNEQLSDQGVKLSVNDFLVRACALAMHKHPFVNSSWVEQGPSIQLHQSVNVGVAVALPEDKGGGLVVATIRDADHNGLRYISSETKRLAKKARDKGLTIDEMSDSTFTISNLGMFGVDHFTAIVNPPNAAILAVGRAVEKPFIEYDEDGDATIVVGHEMSMTMSSDHRIIDGAMAAQYLATVKDYLEKPASLLV